MKFTYAYKTSDGVRHEAAMDAESREAVFAALRQQGIKAIKVVAADGSKANGEIRGIRKRVLAAAVVGAAVLAVIGTVMVGRGLRPRRGEPGVFALPQPFRQWRPPPRQRPPRPRRACGCRGSRRSPCFRPRQRL